MPQAVIPAAIAAVATIGGAVIASDAQSDATDKAMDYQTSATNAQLQLGQQSLGLNRDIYNSNYQTLSPFVGNGLVASNALNALLGLPKAPAMQSPLQQAAPSAPQPAAPQTALGAGTVRSPLNGLISPLMQNPTALLSPAYSLLR